MTIDRIISLIAIIISFVAVPASGYLSYKFAINGEKRKEFNLIADEMRKILRWQKVSLADGRYPGWEIKIDTFWSLVDVTCMSKRKLLTSVWDEYQNALSQSGSYDESGYYVLHAPENIMRAIDALLPFVEHR